MVDIEGAIDDAIKRLEELRISSIGVNHLEKRYFSKIYELTGTYNLKTSSYILKISTTERSCEHEHNMYIYLKNLGIRTLTPIIYSNQFNYLVTEKENLADLYSLLKKADENSRSLYFNKFGKLLRHLEEKTGEITVCDNSEYISYVVNQIKKIKSLSSSDKDNFIKKIGIAAGLLHGKSVISSFGSDFTLGNIHLNENDDFVLLDMGDACHDNRYVNIAGFYLSLKFGPLQQYFENKKKTEEYFSNFLKGYGRSELDKQEFDLYQIKTLVCMILFIESLTTNSNNLIKWFMSSMSNKFLLSKYSRYLKYVLENL